MFASFLLSVREGLEAALIIGILISALRKINQAHLSPAVWRGVLAAVAFSLLAALALAWTGAKFDGRAEEIFEGTAMLSAAGLLTWMIVWMRRQSVRLQQELSDQVRQAVRQLHSSRSLFWLAFLAVGREGLELAIFLFAAQAAAGALANTLGAALGLLAAAILGWMVFSSTRRLNLRQFFQVTNILLVLFAAGLVAHGVHEFNEAGLIPSVVEHVWDVNFLFNEKSYAGQLLTSLFGYNANPSLTEVLAYWGYFLGLGLFWKRMTRPAVSMQPV